MGKNARKRAARQGNYQEYLDILAESDQPESILANWIYSMRVEVVGRIVQGTEYQAMYERIMAALMAHCTPPLKQHKPSYSKMEHFYKVGNS